MLAYRSRYQLFFVAAAVAVWLFVGAGAAISQQIYLEDFEDTTLEPNTTTNLATISGGFASFSDTSTSTRARFVLRRSLTQSNPTFNEPVMTFSFDTKAPVTIGTGGTPPSNELVLRAGTGTSDNTLSSSEFIIEAVAFRDGNRGAFTNNGNETIFVVANRKETDLVFTSPIDDTSTVTLGAYQYINYVRNNDTSDFGLISGIATMTDRNGTDPGPGDIIRLGIGSSSNGNTGTFAIDNVQIVEGVSFVGFVPPVLGDVNGDGFVMMDDFDIIRANFRQSPAARNEGDLSGDSLVSLFDFVEWKGAFLGGGGSLEGADFGFLSVPEPTSLLLTMFAALGLAGCRGRAMRNERSVIQI